MKLLMKLKNFLIPLSRWPLHNNGACQEINLIKHDFYNQWVSPLNRFYGDGNSIENCKNKKISLRPEEYIGDGVQSA